MFLDLYNHLFIKYLMKNFLVLVFAILHFSANAQTLESDRAALVKFFNATNGQQWTNNTNWNADSVQNPCYWFGVGCTNGRVTTINLVNNNLSGTIPIERGEFTALRTLELGINKLTGTIPSELGTLSSLERLSVSNNQLYGQIPPKLASLQNLKEFIFGGNYLTGPIPPALFNMANLTTINLGDNQLTGAIPNAIGRASNLREVYLYNNLLEGPLPDSLGYLPELTNVFLYNNRITGSIPHSVGNLKKLNNLWLYDNQLSGSLPEEFSNLYNLQTLDLHTNQFTGNIPASLGSLSKLNFMNLSQNSLSGSIPAELGNLTSLSNLGLGYNQLTGNIPESLGNIPEIGVLYLVHNQLTGTIPSSLAKLPKLTELHLSNNQLSGPIPDLSGISATAIVDLSYNNFTFEGLESNLPTVDYYFGQGFVPLNVYGKTASINVGGTLSKNTYSWTRNNIPYAVKKGDSTLTLNGDGTYHVQVSNDLIPNLTLLSTSLTYTAGPLPVTLVNFTAKKTAKGNLISWSTTTEVNNAGFEIQRSADAKSFARIARFDGNGNSKSSHTYQFIDTDPFPSSYYKLKQIDFDGTTTYSHQVFVNAEISALKLYPNPTKGDFTLESTDSDNPVLIYDLLGQKVLEMKGKGIRTLQTDQLSRGIYIIQVGSKSAKLVVEK